MVPNGIQRLFTFHILRLLRSLYLFCVNLPLVFLSCFVTVVAGCNKSHLSCSIIKQIAVIYLGSQTHILVVVLLLLAAMFAHT